MDLLAVIYEGPDGFGVAMNRMDNQGVVSVRGEVDLVTAPQLWLALETMLTEGERRIVLDLADLTFIDGSGLRVIAAAQTRSQAIGGELVVRSAPLLTLKLFHITGLAGALTIEAPGPEVSRAWQE
jgi:anti-sigma B factor antagonist